METQYAPTEFEKKEEQQENLKMSMQGNSEARTDGMFSNLMAKSTNFSKRPQSSNEKNVSHFRRPRTSTN